MLRRGYSYLTRLPRTRAACVEREWHHFYRHVVDRANIEGEESCRYSSSATLQVPGEYRHNREPLPGSTKQWLSASQTGELTDLQLARGGRKLIYLSPLKPKISNVSRCQFESEAWTEKGKCLILTAILFAGR